jgi:hypothetical protein
MQSRLASIAGSALTANFNPAFLLVIFIPYSDLWFLLNHSNIEPLPMQCREMWRVESHPMAGVVCCSVHALAPWSTVDILKKHA